MVIRAAITAPLTETWMSIKQIILDPGPYRWHGIDQTYVAATVPMVKEGI